MPAYTLTMNITLILGQLDKSCKLNGLCRLGTLLYFHRPRRFYSQRPFSNYFWTYTDYSRPKTHFSTVPASFFFLDFPRHGKIRRWRPNGIFDNAPDTHFDFIIFSNVIYYYYSIVRIDYYKYAVCLSVQRYNRPSSLSPPVLPSPTVS